MDVVHMPSEEIDTSPSQVTGQSSVGVLLVHGLNGGRGDMEELAAFLAAHGLLTENMLLPSAGQSGHGLYGANCSGSRSIVHRSFWLGIRWAARCACIPLHMKRSMAWWRCALLYICVHGCCPLYNW